MHPGLPVAWRRKSDNELAATVVLKIGPIKATFAGEVTLYNLNPPIGYTISGEGKGGVAGFAKGGADVTLAEDGPTRPCSNTRPRPMSAARSPSSAAG